MPSILWYRKHPSAGGCACRGCPSAANGAGDAVAALFFVHHLRARPAAEAMALSASAMFGVLRRTAEAGAGEMLLVEAQDEFVAPSRVFVPQRI